ncbi:HNH endonuclease [Nodularia sp. UHCC 0506]|uniref:HNH endonuclease n=1 Tax=Nodularia sp. UHCC 0506 TaxID=3110243 RepID=UPI003A4C6716
MYVIPAPENQQLKLLDKYKYSNLSTAYIYDNDGCFYVYIKIDSIETENNHPSNGLLLRADLHNLFDLNLIAINPQTMKVHISPILKKTEYRTIEGKKLRVPKDDIYLPNQQFLKQRFEQCKW